jgi:hypothetical protein
MARQSIRILSVLFWLCPALYAQDLPVCSAEIAFTNAKPIVNTSEVLNLNLFSTVSRPSRCFSAEIHITAAFYDVEENLICSGTLLLMNQSTNVLSTNIEVRPLNSLEFVRVVDPSRPPAKRLFCNNLEGNAEVGSTQMAAANSLRLRATILPANGGLATSEARMGLRVSR